MLVRTQLGEPTFLMNNNRALQEDPDVRFETSSERWYDGAWMISPMSTPPSIGFDSDRYLRAQARAIRKFIGTSRDKLYIEFGGKIIHDKHSARILPGYREDAKFELIRKLCRNGEAIFVVSARDIAKGRIRGDFGITYDQETLRVLREFKRRGLAVRYVAISLLRRGERVPPVISRFAAQLHRRGIATYRFSEIKDYPSNRVDVHAFRANPFIPVRKKLVMIISPGGGSGKFGVCLNQLYYELSSGRSPRYLKFETFPVHDLPIDHPVNVAYMAASADFYDVVMRDRRHAKHATSYERDLQNYEVLRKLARTFPVAGKHLRKLTSATSMGINLLSRGIVDDEVVQREAAAEVARRLIRYKFEVRRHQEDPQVLARVRNVLRLL